MNDLSIRYVTAADGTSIAYEHLAGEAPTVVFLGGYNSEMAGTKGSFLSEWCRRKGRAFLRFDYAGHGLSGGAFVDGTIGRWRDDALLVIDHCVTGPVVLVGSSMGGWIMLLVARALGERVAGMVGVAAAPDFTRDLMWEAFDEDTRRRLREEGMIRLPSEYDDWEVPVRMAFIEDGLDHIQLDSPIPLRCPVHLLHGRRDPDVPWRTAEKLSEQLESSDVTISYFKDGDHRLSEPVYLQHLANALDLILHRPDVVDGVNWDIEK